VFLLTYYTPKIIF